MSILKPLERLQSPELDASGTGVDVIQAGTKESIADAIMRKTEAGNVLDEELLKTIDALIILVQSISTAMDGDSDEELKNSVRRLWYFLMTNPKSIMEVLHMLRIFKEKYKTILPETYSRDFSNLVLYWDGFGGAIHPCASESDKSHMYTQAITIPALLRIFRDFHLPELACSIQSSQA